MRYFKKIIYIKGGGGGGGGGGGALDLRFLKETKVLEWFEWRSLYPVRVSDILH